MVGGGARASGRVSVVCTLGRGWLSLSTGWFEGSASPSLCSGLWASWMPVAVVAALRNAPLGSACAAVPALGGDCPHTLFLGRVALGGDAGPGVTPAPLDPGERRPGGAGVPGFSSHPTLRQPSWDCHH